MRRRGRGGLAGAVLRLIDGLGFMAVTLAVASSFLFLSSEVLPGDPVTAFLGPQASPEAVASLRTSLELDRPAWVRYASWLSRAVTGDLGVALSTGTPVVEHLRGPVTDTITLAVLTFVLAAGAGLGAGTVAALRAGSRLDSVLGAVAIVLLAVPSFVVGSMITLVASTWAGLLPPVVRVPFGASPLADPAGLVLPVLTLAAFPAAWLARMVRAIVVDGNRSGHVQAARLAGLPERQVLGSHLFPTVLAPTAQALSWTFGGIFSGTAVVERLYDYPGISEPLMEAVRVHDTALLEGIGLVMVAVVAAAFFLADLFGPDRSPGSTLGAARHRTGTAGRACRRAAVPLVVVAVVVLLPWIPAADPNTVESIPFAAPAPGHPLGLDDQGRDVLARLLDGGRPLVVLPLAGTLLTTVAGVATGAIAAALPSSYRGTVSRLDLVLLALPPVLVVLVLLNGWGATPAPLLVAVVLTGLPYVHRITYTAVREHLRHDYVRQAAALGDGPLRCFLSEILPGIMPRVLADAGSRFAIAITLLAGVTFLGFGNDEANWSAMVGAGVAGLALNPLATLTPAVALAVLTVSATLLLTGGDGPD